MYNKVCIIIASILVIATSMLISILACAGTLTIYVHLFGFTPYQGLAAGIGFGVFLFIGLVGVWFEYILPESIN